MTRQQYETSRAEIIVRILRHEKTMSDGRYLFPRSLSADYRELDKLDKQWELLQQHLTM